MAPKPTVWDLAPHTKAKHDILRRYLGAWVPIMSRQNGRILFFDGFAGPGVYSKGEEGSPVIALRIAAEHRFAWKGELVCVFMELDEKRRATLEGVLNNLALPAHIRYHVYGDRFQEKMIELLDELDADNQRLAPGFFFLDPFGYSHTPMHVVARIMRHRKCEVLITFIYERMNQFITSPDPKNRAHCTDLFGTDEWQAVGDCATPSERKRFLHDLYLRQLRSACGVKYVRSFEMLDDRNHTEYFLFFGTNHMLGLKRMKEAMWKVDPSGGNIFSDATDTSQETLFVDGPDFQKLRIAIREWAGTSEWTVDQLEEFVLTSTPFRETHFKLQILVPWEKEGVIEVLRSPRKKRGYPSGTVLRIASPG